MVRKSLVLVCAVFAASLFAVQAAGAQPGSSRPVPSLTPKATAKLWTQLVHHRRTFGPRATADCAPLRAVFYAATDWLRLATKLAANPSPCAQYYISIPPLAADKTAFRNDQAWRIRALGPQFHVLAEMNVTGWSSWVTTTGSSWHAAGLEARRRMAAAGYDAVQGDSWIVNELSSAVRQGTGSGRANMRAFMRGLYEGDGMVPAVRGAVFITGMAQSTVELSVYQSRLQDWYEDAAFWQDMSAYVNDWSQELYGDIRNYAVAGADPATRRASLNEYLQHEVTLAQGAPESAADARSFLAAAYNPLANAAWQYDAAFGWTNVSFDLMQDYVSAQTDALRSFNGARFGFAWAPKYPGGAWTPDFVAQSDAVLVRLAASITDPAGACTGTWCTGTYEGSAVNTGWRTFATWKQSKLAFTSAPQSIGTETASQPLTVGLQTNTGVTYATGVPLTVTLASSSEGGAFSTTAAGGWTSTLSVTIASGTSTATVYYRDTIGGTPTLTASAVGRTGGTQTETITAADTTPPETTVTSAPSGSIASTSATVSFSASEAASFTCSLDGATFASCASPASYAGLPQGSHTVSVRATDVAGNVDATPATARWTVDTVAPDTRFTAVPASTTTSRTATFWFAASESGIRFECSFDGGAFSSCASPWSAYVSRTTHAFRVRAIDGAGNADATPAAYSWRVK